MKKIFCATFIVVVLFIISCDSPPCSVENYYLLEQPLRIYKDSTDTTYYGIDLYLEDLSREINQVWDTLQVDTLIIESKMDTIYSSRMLISSKPRGFSIGDSIVAGNQNIGGNFSKIKIKCIDINIADKYVDLMISKGKFIQDCSNWND